MKKLLGLIAVIFMILMIPITAKADGGGDYLWIGGYSAYITSSEYEEYAKYGDIVTVDYEYYSYEERWVYVRTSENDCFDIPIKYIVPIEYKLSNASNIDPTETWITYDETKVYDGPSDVFPVNAVLPKDKVLTAKLKADGFHYVEWEGGKGWVSIIDNKDDPHMSPLLTSTVYKSVEPYNRMAMKDLEIIGGNNEKVQIRRGDTLHIVGYHYLAGKQTTYVLLVEIDGNYYFVNDSITTAMGSSDKSYLAGNYVSIINPDDITIYDANFSNIRNDIILKSYDYYTIVDAYSDYQDGNTYPYREYQEGDTCTVLINYNGEDIWLESDKCLIMSNRLETGGLNGFLDGLDKKVGILLDSYGGRCIEMGLAVDYYSEPELTNKVGTYEKDSSVYYSCLLPIKDKNGEVKLVAGLDDGKWALYSELEASYDEYLSHWEAPSWYPTVNDEPEETAIKSDIVVDTENSKPEVNETPNIDDVVFFHAPEETASNQQPGSSKLTIYLCAGVAVLMAGATIFVIIRLYLKKKKQNTDEMV